MIFFSRKNHDFYHPWFVVLFFVVVEKACALMKQGQVDLAVRYEKRSMWDSIVGIIVGAFVITYIIFFRLRVN